MVNSSSPSPLTPRSGIMARVYPIITSHFHRSLLTPLIFSLVIAVVVPIASSIPLFNSPGSVYSKFCNDFAPESTPTNTKADNYANLGLEEVYFSGGESILGQKNNSWGNPAKAASLQIQNIYKTEADGIFYVYAYLKFWSSNFVGFSGNLTRGRVRQRQIHYRRPRIPVRRSNTFLFQLQGFWSESSGKLCMVGTGLTNFPVDVALKLTYPIVSTLEATLVSGTLVCTNTSSGLNQFEPISILGVSKLNYQYKYVDKEIEKGTFTVYDYMDNAAVVNTYHGVCSAIRHANRFELEYVENCDNVSCNPLGRDNRILPDFMSLNEVNCTGDKVRYLLDFSNLTFNGRHLPFDPNTTLVAEGAWDSNKKHLDLLGCRIFNITDSVDKASIGDCSIRLSLRFPATLSLKNRSLVVGLMWSSKSVNDSGYFGKVAFQSPRNGNTKVEALKYEYTEIENAKRSCSKKVTHKHKEGTYPNGLSPDMRFDMTVRDAKGQRAWGYSSPLSVGDMFYQHRPMFAGQIDPWVQVNSSQDSEILNVSYIVSFRPRPGFKLGRDEASTKLVEISAEGTYDPKTGVLCMLGCRYLKSRGKKISKNDTFDCEILINIQYSPLNSKDNVKGTIESKRKNSDSLYFDTLELSASSIFMTQAQESIWRMDLEITMVLISNTLMCIFVILQLFYVKKYPDVLPFISIIMLTVLTLAQMIPLVLNFEAMFMSSRNRQTVYFGSGGWLEVNEVLVRVITMIAFLLEFRLLQQAWSARFGDENSKGLWVSDKKVLYLSLPLYMGGGLIAWLAHQWMYSYKTPVLNFSRLDHQYPSFWRDSKSYAGLILDGFLLPQIMFNIFCNTREKALAPSFYVGTTVVRLLPHAYDLYRAHGSSWYFSGIYANPGMDYYSTVWDIVISCGGLLFIVLVYLQQRFGGCCFLPKRFRESTVYEKVPVVSNE